MACTLVVEQRRGAWLEATHVVAAALCDADGAVLERAGDPCVTTWRSGAKPFQLEACLALLPPDAVAALSDEDLAVGAASHSGEEGHVARVRALLGRFGASEGELLCGGHWPMHEPSARALGRVADSPGAIHNNCSGKHSFMVAALRAQGLPPDYRDPAHALQRAIRARVDERCGGGVLDVVVDGCGVPCFVAEVGAMARAFAALAREAAGGSSGLGRVGRAMLAHPELVSGTGRHDLQVARGAAEPVISKVGAEGLACMAFPARGLGLGLKVTSGAEAARGPAVQAVLDRWLPGVLPPGPLEEAHVVRNVVGRAVGRREAIWG